MQHCSGRVPRGQGVGADRLIRPPRSLILTGLTEDICVLFTAKDAFLRDLGLVVPSDCVASLDPGDNEHALRYMQRVLNADTTPSPALDLAGLARSHGRPRAA